MKKMIKINLTLLLISTIFLTSCFRTDVTYTGDFPELFSVALHSLLGAKGYEGGHLSSPSIRVLEEDSYGRVLFLYHEDWIYSNLIIQKFDDDYAYFYPYYNFILTYGMSVGGYPEGFSFGFDDEEVIDELKEANSWNQPMSDSSEFERVPIVRLIEVGPVTLETLNEVYFELFPQATRRIDSGEVNYTMNFLRTDKYGRSVYFAIGTGSDRRRNPYAVIFQPDHSFDLETGVLEITDINNYQTELRLLMESNGWNEPWDD